MEKNVNKINVVSFYSTAGMHLRLASFMLDVVFANFFRSLLLQIFVFTQKQFLFWQEFFHSFKDLFGQVNPLELKDYHLRYLVGNEHMVTTALQAFLILAFTGIFYTFFSSLLLGNATPGQKIMSLHLVRLGDGEKPKIWQLLLRSILLPIPFEAIFLGFCVYPLFLVNFHLYAPRNHWFVRFLVGVVEVSTNYWILVALVTIFMLWYSIYYFTNGLLPSDLGSYTRVIRFRNRAAPNAKGLIYVGDKLLSYLERFNAFLLRLLSKILDYMVNIISNLKKNSDKKK
jgi:hypothetical protein